MALETEEGGWESCGGVTGHLDQTRQEGPIVIEATASRPKRRRKRGLVGCEAAASVSRTKREQEKDARVIVPTGSPSVITPLSCPPPSLAAAAPPPPPPLEPTPLLQSTLLLFKRRAPMLRRPGLP
ncbi:hypothetical protein G6O67_008722 [Ophiocordyceps sinensis]|uniref:Uncharacterized protein n=1 Tax=Ophiocordyceps sinensis TaxID=72228 RepID=A0A8H4LQX7_9HYPO|nr:hypothetical protein G6O67_008722 [Ophiocordyceps sinensis]